ncbi:MAG: glycosyltransferase family 4 protein [Bacteroidales bacterium]
MNILILCNKSPWPPREGGPIAMNAIIQGLLKQGHQVKVLAINSNKYGVNLEDIPKNYREKTGIETVYIDLSVKAPDAFFNLFTGKSYHVERFISENFREKLIQILQKDRYDIIQLETLFISPYINTIREYSEAKIVLRAHNIEHLIWERVAAISRNPLKKVYLRHLARTLKNYETGMLNRYDGIATITKKDGAHLKALGCRAPLIDIPFGIDLEHFRENPGIDPEFPSLFHIGSMNWMPNQEGVKWFLDQVWPAVHEQHPKLKFYIAGREMPAWLTHAKIPNVVVVGEVDDAFDFIYSKAIEVVPLFSGSGIRIKIIEGMAARRAVISTSIGAEGINVSHGKNILIADTAEAFIETINKCIRSRMMCTTLGENARKLIETDHSNSRLMEKLTAFYHQIV